MEIRPPRDERELAAALALREAVFCGEQGVTFDGDRGVARALLAAAEAEARAAGAARIGMHAQTDALRLYERAGYTPFGERFEEQGIEHLGMEKQLA